jgi:general secretion pathway protein G
MEKLAGRYFRAGAGARTLRRARLRGGTATAHLVPYRLRRPARGFTFIELLLVLAIIGVLASIAVPMVGNAVNRARVGRAIGEIRAIQTDIAGLDSLPDTLDDIGRGGMRDPWGRPYVYLRLAGARPNVIGQARKDRFLVPLNSDYDLYSVGVDGDSRPPILARPSRDDVLRANNGGFIGLAVRY